MRPYTGKETQPGSTPGYVRAGYGNTAISMYSPIIYSACLIKTN